MRKTLAFIVAATWLLLLSCTTTQKTGEAQDTKSLDNNIQFARAACFQVVAEKPTQDSLSYEKPLNWDALDYATRNDKYIPLGTAFAISATELVTAAHVLTLSTNSLVCKTRFIREKVKEGGKSVEHIYVVENIHAFNNNRDYVIFTVKGKTFDTWLKVGNALEFNKKVFTAGDAFGEGIVVREGVLLDTVPEPENGSWSFLRSSIAINPGSSGGPLLNERFEVIGIALLRKDDFCYSLPMNEIVPGKAVMHLRVNLGFAVFTKRKEYTLDETWDLPMKYGDLIHILFDKYMAFYNDGMDGLLAAYEHDLFPNGVNSEQALYLSGDTIFPQIFLQDSTTGLWFLTDLEISSTDIGKNGIVATAEIRKDYGVWLVALDAPDDIPVRRLYDDPRFAMDMLLRGIDIRRQLTDSDQGSRVTSYGTPIQTLSHTDRYGRIWQINIYLLEYSDQVVITCATPTPRGLSMIYVPSASSAKDALLYDIRKITDFVIVSYSGTLERWDEFLRQPDFHSAAMRNVSVSYKDHATLEVITDNFDCHIHQGLIDITKDSFLFLFCGVYQKNRTPVFNIRKFAIHSSSSSGSYYTLYRWTQPTDSLPKSIKDTWQSVLDRKHPFTGKANTSDGQTYISMLHPAFVDGGNTVIKGDFIYTLSAVKEGDVSEDEMMQHVLAFSRDVKIKE